MSPIIVVGYTWCIIIEGIWVVPAGVSNEILKRGKAHPPPPSSSQINALKGSNPISRTMCECMDVCMYVRYLLYHLPPQNDGLGDPS
jgi:hypothetical protein